MKAITYQGHKDVKVKEVHDPRLEKPDDMIIRDAAGWPPASS